MAEHSKKTHGLTAKERQSLFLEFAGRTGGTTAQDVYEKALQLGDSATVEAFHNLGRRLAHRGILVPLKQDRQTFFSIGANIEEQWLDEEQLASIVDPDYPLIALTAYKESLRQLREIPESVWVEMRERLKAEPAQKLFTKAIMDYADNLRDEIEDYKLESERSEPSTDLPKLRQQIENILMMLKGLTKYGLGLSYEAIKLPANVDVGLRQIKENPEISFYNESALAEEINRRVSFENIIVEVGNEFETRELLVAAVDGSTRGGLLTLQGETGDLTVGYAPMASINTAVAQINKSVRVGQGEYPAFMRLPEKPEDMQQQANRYTIMAKLFYPDLSDSEYAHSLWNAMDVLESRATLRVMSRWYTSKTNLEVTPADVVMRDGTLTPNDRDFYHYKEQNSYGQIVRDLIESNWDIARKCQDNDQTLCGVVKNANLRVFSPIINWFFCHMAAKEDNSQLTAWPLRTMNLLSDQTLLTRILTAGMKKGSPWHRTCVVLRPFHATTNFAQEYSRESGRMPMDEILQKAERVAAGQEGNVSELEKAFWSNFRGEKDVYVQMLRNVWYAGFFLGYVPRLDIEKTLPRFELLVVKNTEEKGDGPSGEIKYHLRNFLGALKKMGFDVSSDHSMFASEAKIDVLPAQIIRVHETVKIWATELLSRVQEYMGFHLREYYRGNKRGIRIRKWGRAELTAWIAQMQRERNMQAGVLTDEGKKGIEPES